MTVVIPVYNQEVARLEKAISSVREQDYGGHVELLVVDDGSDRPAPWATHRLEKNQGISAALNKGLEEMSSPWFAWLSSDDEFDKDKLTKQMTAVLESDALASCHSYRICQDGVQVAQARAPQWRSLEEQAREQATSCKINGSTTLIHRSVFDVVGLFDASFRYGQDWEMWCRIGRRFLWQGLKQVLGTRHDWRGSLTSQLAQGGTETRRRDAEDTAIRATFAGPGSR